MAVPAIDTWTISGNVVPGVINQQNWLMMRTSPRPLKEVTKDVTTTSLDTFDTPVTVRESDAQMVDSPTQELTSELTHGVEEPGRHYPSRARRPPDRLTY